MEHSVSGESAGARAVRPRTVASAIEELDATIRSGRGRELVAIPTGFQPLDRVLHGGVRPGELMLVGGAPGVGKTIATLQWARNMAASGKTVLYVCYEHQEADLLLRLLALEMGELGEAPDADGGRERFQAALAFAAGMGGQGLDTVLASEELARQAYARVEEYAQRLWLVRASGARTGLAEIERLVSGEDREQPEVLFVDYLQKVAVIPSEIDELEKVRLVAEGLKDLALTYRIPVVSVVASDLDGLRSRRLRFHHFRGSSALAFESDVILVLNEKFRALSKVHLAYDPLRAQSFRAWVVFSIEKNRGGQNLIDLEHRKDFEHLRFDPFGGLVAEKLADEGE